MAMTLPYPSPENDFLAEHIALLCASYRHLIGQDLLDRFALGPTSTRPPTDPPTSGTHPADAHADRLFHAPIVLLSHNSDPDPIFVYGNRTALAVFELDWTGLTRMYSRLTAEPAARAERSRLLEEVAAKGFIAHYTGVRVSTTGRRFLIEDAVVWNLIDRHGHYQGQAAAFDHWTPL
jgi:hypothetical protein